MKNESLSFLSLFITALIMFTAVDMIRHHDDLSLVFTYINISANLVFCVLIAAGWKAFEKLRNLYLLYTNYLIKKTEALDREVNK